MHPLNIFFSINTLNSLNQFLGRFLFSQVPILIYYLFLSTSCARQLYIASKFVKVVISSIFESAINVERMLSSSLQMKPRTK